MIKLKFGTGNEKLEALAVWLGIPKNHIVSFDIPAGYTCSKANICLSYANRKTGKIRQMSSVLCYAAKGERYLPNMRASRWHNYMGLLGCGVDVEGMVELLLNGIRKQTEIVRIHSGGDFYSLAYFQAWLIVAGLLPNVKFFGYTKHLEYATFKKPSNFILQYSFGGKDDAEYLELVKRGNKIPTCFIGQYEGQYPHKVICGEGGEHEDFFAIQKGEDFVINGH